MRATTAAALLGTCAIGLGASVWSASAGAQEEPARGPLPAPSNTFELKLGTGYTQGVGKLSEGRTIGSVAGAGIGFSVDLDYRINPIASVGVATQYTEFTTFTTVNNGAARGVASNVGVTLHVLPNAREDPWVRLGTGYRFLWDVNPPEAPNDSIMFHGLDVLTAKVGYDIRRGQNVAVAPVVGADLQTFLWANGTPLSSVQLGTFFYAGAQGRFDFAGPRRGTVAQGF